MENYVWLWFKICWKWVQGSLIFNLPQEKDKTHRVIKWHNMKPDIPNIGELHGWICDMCTAHHKCTSTKVKLAFVWNCYKIYQLSYWNTSSSHHGKEATSRNVSPVHLILTIFCLFRNLYTFFWKRWFLLV
jgi:hypothetical protein